MIDMRVVVAEITVHVRIERSPDSWMPKRSLYESREHNYWGGCQAVMLAGKSGKSPHNPGYSGDANTTLPLPLGEGWGEGHTRRHCGKRHFQVLNHGPGRPDTLTPALSQGERDLQCRFPRLPSDLPCDLYRNLD